MDSRLVLLLAVLLPSSAPQAIVLTTWQYENATEAAWRRLSSGGSALDAAEAACSRCEALQCRGTVGFGGSPDESGETTLDALVMDGRTLRAGAVGGLRRVKAAVAVARSVLEHTRHTLLVGDQATRFAVEMGFLEESLTTRESAQKWQLWRDKQACQPNFWTSVTPDPRVSCGPYTPVARSRTQAGVAGTDRSNHDTIGVVVLDSRGRTAAATSTNGLIHKIPGRVGDSPIPGAGGYADNRVGAAAATGNGDLLMRFLPSFLAVEEMRRGSSPETAAASAVSRVLAKYPAATGGVVAVDIHGRFGAACIGFRDFKYTLQSGSTGAPRVVSVPCTFPE